MEGYSLSSDLQLKKEIVDFFISQQILVHANFLNSLPIHEIFKVHTLLHKHTNLATLTSLHPELAQYFSMPISAAALSNILKILTALDEKKGIEKPNQLKEIPPIKEFPQLNSAEPAKMAQVSIISSYREEPIKRKVKDFIALFTKRYHALESMLRHRQELQHLTSINKILGKREKETVSIIGMISDKQISKNGNIMLTVEDMTGSIKLMVSKSKPDIFEKAKDLVLDEVIGICGMNGENILFVNNIVWPDVPMNKELKKSPDECYAIFLSDMHVGSTNFLEENFQKFLRWINGEFGSKEQREISQQVRYVFIIGDLIDGCGIYPEQDKELTIKDINQQYEVCAELLSHIPKHIKIIVCPGNHDALRISEPQPELYKDFAASLWELPNIVMVSNPAYVTIHAQKGFPGFDVLMYHGYSFDYYVANVDSIRNRGGYNRADLIMKFLLQRRHLAPTHKSTLYIPETTKDPLVIEKLPDFFVTGHIHKTSVSHYRNITLISGSCWQSKTIFQEKVGHNPEPCRVPAVNLQTRAVKILRF
jgi:DNA polymerase II small subunit